MKIILTCLAALTSLLFVSCSTTTDVPEPTPGAYFESPVTDPDVIAAAKYAVKAQGKAHHDEFPEDSYSLQLVSIEKAEQQVVSGMNFRLLLHVKENGTPRLAQAIVWWQAWNQASPYQLTGWEWVEQTQSTGQ